MYEKKIVISLVKQVAMLKVSPPIVEWVTTKENCKGANKTTFQRCEETFPDDQVKDMFMRAQERVCVQHINTK